MSLILASSKLFTLSFSQRASTEKNSRSEEAKANLPPLPEIKSEQILLQAFTHRSFYARQTHLFEDHPQDPSPDNEMQVLREDLPDCRN